MTQPETRWTPETERLVFSLQSWSDPLQGAQDTLAALAEAGLLVTPEVAAVLVEARRAAAEAGRWEVDALDDLVSAVDALDATRPDPTGAAT